MGDAHDRAPVLDPRRVLMERWGCHVMGRPFSGPDLGDQSLSGESLQQIIEAIIPVLSDD